MAVIEVATFTLAQDDESFLAADQRMQTDFAYQQPGCLRRTTARGDDGDWLILTLWADAESADAAANAETGRVAAEFWATVESESLRRRRFTTLPG